VAEEGGLDYPKAPSSVSLEGLFSSFSCFILLRLFRYPISFLFNVFPCGLYTIRLLAGCWKSVGAPFFETITLASVQFGTRCKHSLYIQQSDYCNCHLPDGAKTTLQYCTNFRHIDFYGSHDSSHRSDN